MKVLEQRIFCFNLKEFLPQLREDVVLCESSSQKKRDFYLNKRNSNENENQLLFSFMPRQEYFSFYYKARY